MGRAALLIQGDITSAEGSTATLDQVQAAWARLDLLILNASGGLEQDKASDYAIQLNFTAQVNLVKGALPMMKPRGRIVFVTSHLAHFHGSGPRYEVIKALQQVRGLGKTLSVK